MKSAKNENIKIMKTERKNETNGWKYKINMAKMKTKKWFFWNLRKICKTKKKILKIKIENKQKWKKILKIQKTKKWKKYWK